MAIKGICFTVHDSAYWPNFNLNYQIFQRTYPGWKATFYMDRWASQSGTVKSQMLAAQANGIEIGNSTEVVADTYLQTHTAQQFYDNILAVNAADMVAGGITPPTSFALDTGVGSRALINTILAQGGSTRLVFKACSGIFPNQTQGNGYYKNIFAQGGGGLAKYDFSIDAQKATHDETYFLEQLAYCKANNDVIIHVGHDLRLAYTTDNGLDMLFSTVHKLSRYCACNGMSFYTVNDLLNAGIVGTESALPYLINIAVSGTFSSGNNLTATYTFTQDNDVAESTSTFQWYRANDAIGTGAAAIGGATALIYTLTGSDTGKYVRLGITPKTASQTGNEAFTKWFAIS